MSFRFNPCNPCCNSCDACKVTPSAWLLTLPTIGKGNTVCDNTAILNGKSFLCYKLSNPVGFCQWDGDPITICAGAGTATVVPRVVVGGGDGSGGAVGAGIMGSLFDVGPNGSYLTHLSAGQYSPAWFSGGTVSVYPTDCFALPASLPVGYLVGFSLPSGDNPILGLSCTVEPQP